MEKEKKHEYTDIERQAMQWYGWGSPIGLGIGLSCMLISVGVFIWLLHQAGLY